MEEKYQLALTKIIKLVKKNPEFGDALREALGVNELKKVSSSSVDSSRVAEIERYLGLDFGVDRQKSLIDYSFIDDEFVFQQLVSDNREMMRFRYGTRSHSIDFLEYCRYAHLQAEMLLNYFYSYGNPSLEEIKARIKDNYFTNDLNLSKTNSIHAISFSYKLSAYAKEFALDYYSVTKVLENVKNVRNEQSHRSIDDFSVNKYREKLLQKKMPLYFTGEVNATALKGQAILKNIFETKIKTDEQYKIYCLALWCERKPFDEILEVLRRFADSIAANLEKKKERQKESQIGDEGEVLFTF